MGTDPFYTIRKYIFLDDCIRDISCDEILTLRTLFN